MQLRAGCYVWVLPSLLLSDTASELYRMDHEGVPLYYDNHHLTRHGAVFVRDLLAPMLHPVSRETSHHSPTLPANH